jgi:hypothetical protein
MDAAKTLDLKARAGGVALAACGAFLLKTGFFDVLRDAEAGAAHVSTSMKAVLVAPAFMMFGLLLMVIGAPGDGGSGIGRHFTNAADRKLKPLGWVLAIATLLPGLVLYLWLDSRLSALGFE